MTPGSTAHSEEGAWGLRGDLFITNALLWVAGAGRVGEPTPEVHLYLYDRYSRLAEHYDRRGYKKKALRLRAKVEAHYSRSAHTGHHLLPRWPCLARDHLSSRGRWQRIGTAEAPMTLPSGRSARCGHSHARPSNWPLDPPAASSGRGSTPMRYVSGKSQELTAEGHRAAVARLQPSADI